MVHNLELYPGRGGQAVRSAGGAAQLLSKEGDLALVKMPSGEVRKFSVDCMATVGQVGNLDHENETYGKAGRTRWHGVKPTVRGVAMNPVDHPHGGGEGSVKGNHPQTPWAFPTLGKKTRHNKRTDGRLCSDGSKQGRNARSCRSEKRNVRCESRAVMAERSGESANDASDTNNTSRTQRRPENSRRAAIAPGDASGRDGPQSGRHRSARR